MALKLKNPGFSGIFFAISLTKIIVKYFIRDTFGLGYRATAFKI